VEITSDFGKIPWYHFPSGVFVMKTFALIVFGCQMNVYDADRLRTQLIAEGWTETSQEDAEVLLFVTCSIREKAEQKVWSLIGRFQKKWDSQKKPYMAIVGCMAQRVGEKLMKRFPGIFMVAGPRHLGVVFSGIQKFFSQGEKSIFLDEDPRGLEDLHCPPLCRPNPWKAYITIAHGCDNFCTYCIVPYVRGRFQSREPEDILQEARSLIEQGVLEITLLGQNVNSYGTDRKDTWTFPRLLRECAALPGLRRLRFATNHPKDLSPEVISVMAEGAPVICPALNLPIQSGSDEVLKKMNRGYTVEQYASIISLLREAMPHVGITSDLIVGFPGESEEDFQSSLEVLRRFRFDLVHSAAYSPRPGTSSASMEQELSREDLFHRLHEVNSLQSKIALEKNEKLAGTLQDVLFDALAPRGENLLQGRTPTDKVVLVPGNEDFLGRFGKVRILSGEHWCLRGEVEELEPR